jgi:putative ABC transport system permease protein
MNILHDLRYSLRLMRRKPGPALVSGLTMALGIAATTILFSVTWGVLMKPLPWPDADRLVRLQETRQGATRKLPRIMTNGSFVAWSDAPATIESLAAYSPQTLTLTESGDPQRVTAAAVSASLFPMMRAVPLRGSLFTAMQEIDHVVLLSNAFWRRQFGGREDLVGTTIKLDGVAYTVSGILGDDFAFPERETQAWIPFRVQPVSRPGVQGTTIQVFSAIARLKSSVSPAQAAQEATVRGRSGADPGLTAIAVFGSRGPVEITAEPVLAALTADVRQALLVLLAAVCLLLAAATANIAGVQLARSAMRRRELAVRAAIGASGGRLARQLLLENLAVGLLGGIAGLAAAMLIHRALPSILPSDFPRVADIAIDFRAAGFAFMVSLLASSTFGLVPALQARRLNLVTGLVDDAGAAGGGFGRSATARTRALIMAAQVAVACVLLVGASLLIKTFTAMLAVDRGYDASNVLTARIATPSGLFTNARRAALVTETLAQLRARPEVIAAGTTNVIPLGRTEAMMAFSLPPAAGASEPQQVQTSFRSVSPGYFEAMGIPILEGRAFTDADTRTSMPVLVVNRTFAQRFLGERPVGRRLPAAVYDGMPDWEVAGVAEDVRTQSSVTEPAQPEMYVSYTQAPSGLASDPTIAVRTRGNPEALIPALRQILASQDRSAAADAIMTMEQRVMGSLARPRLYAIVLTGFAAFALAIAGVGLFGVLSYSVSQRARELGVRAALGARPADIVRLVLREGLAISLLGITTGLAGSFVFARWMGSFLYQVQAADTATFLMVPLVLLAMAALACVVPARRAAKLDPLAVLRA